MERAQLWWCVFTLTLPGTFSYRKLILILVSDYFPQSVLLSSLETLLCHTNCCKEKRVHDLFLFWQVRRWIKSPMVNAEKHPHASLKYPGSTVMNLPAGDSEMESPLCQTCLSDHPFQRGIAPQEAESCSWESQRNRKVSHSFLPTNFVYMFYPDNRSVLTMGLYLWGCVPLEEKGCSKTWKSADQGFCVHLGSAFYLEHVYPWKTLQ